MCVLVCVCQERERDTSIKRLIRRDIEIVCMNDGLVCGNLKCWIPTGNGDHWLTFGAEEAANATAAGYACYDAYISAFFCKI